MERLASLLLEFGRSPGRYLLRMREPAELFGDFDTVAQWALGRVPAELGHRSHEITAAAVLFIQRACFAPECSYYQTLGLEAGEHSAEELRARYRTMIRLAHPDMGVKGLPHNAATLVNRAHEVLSDPAARQRYNEQLARQATPPFRGSLPPSEASLRRNVAHKYGWHERWQIFKAQHPRILRTGAVAGGVFVLLGVLLTWAAQDASDSRMLIAARAPVQRPPAPNEDVVRVPDELRLAMSSTLAQTPQVPTNTSVGSLPAVAPATISERESKGLVAYAAPPAPVAGPALVEHATVAQNRPTKPPGFAAPEAAVAVPTPELRPVAPTATSTPAPTVQSVSPSAKPAPATVALPNAALTTASTPASPLAAAATSPTPTPAPTPTPTPLLPAPVPAAPPVWSVDAEGARMYLSELVSKLSNPADARQVNAYLQSMKVKGSLLRAVLDTAGTNAELHVRPSHWTESAKPGSLYMQATVLVQPKAANHSEPQALQFRMTAAFQGSAEGTMLATLDFKQTE